jgi:thiamine-monophosphate kinase
MPGEFDFIDWVRTQQRPSGLVPVPAGDDLAVLNWPAGDLLIVGVDQVLDGVHFESTRHSPIDIGRKAMNRNLSDCAAMACLPAAAVVTLALPKTASLEYAQSLYAGINEAGDAFDCQIVGGDTGSWPGKLAITVTILGRSAGVMPVRRSGGKPKNVLYVSGPLGGSILGRHLAFTPRIELARKLAAGGSLHAMLDLSDGLSRDVRHLCRESGVGAVIDAAAVPIHADAITLARQTGKPPLDHALHDGEDYELLAAMESSSASETLARSFGMTPVGRLTAETGIWLNDGGLRRPLEPLGWQHALGQSSGETPVG